MGRKISIILIYIVQLFQIGCVKLGGLYISHYEDASGTIEEQLFLKDDYSFIYYPPDGLAFKYDSVSGVWRKEGKFIILNSNLQDTISHFFFQESMDSQLSSDSVFVRIYDMVTKMPIHDFSVGLTQEGDIPILLRTNEYGEVVIPKNMFDKHVFTTITSYGQVPSYLLLNKNNNIVMLYVQQYLYPYFIEESFKVKGKNLVQKFERYKIKYVKKCALRVDSVRYEAKR